MSGFLWRAVRVTAAAALVALCQWAAAQPASVPGPQNQVQLSASATVEVPQDLLTIRMNTVREGPDAAAVQALIKQAVDAALTEARKLALPGQLDVHSGNFSLYPRYGRDGKMGGWQGSAEVVLEGRDFGRISTAAGRIQTLTVSGVAFGLSREQAAKTEVEAQAMAIERFKSRAADIARGFGFAGFSLREVAVSAQDQMPVALPRAMAVASRAPMADAPVPVEAGKSVVTVTVSGSVQLK